MEKNMQDQILLSRLLLIIIKPELELVLELIVVSELVALSAELNVSRSAPLNSRLSGPPRLPSPVKISSSERCSLYCVGNFHFSSKGAGRVPSKQPTAYLPMLGRNLNALYNTHT